MKKKWLAAMLGAAAMAVSAGAVAQQRDMGFYLGGAVGNAEVADEDDTAFKVLGGYRFNRHFAGEAAYSLLLDVGPVEVTALELTAVGTFPLANRFSLLGRVGFANVEADFPGGSEDDTELTFGFGVQYDLSSNLGLRGEWQRYDTEEEVDVLSIGLIYRF